MEQQQIRNILSNIQGCGFTNSLTRVLKAYNIVDEMQVIEAIGKMKRADFVIDSDNRFIYENLVRWANGDAFQCLDNDGKRIINGSTRKGIYIAGNTGTGKSWALEILCAYTCARGITLLLNRANSKQVMLVWSNIRTDKICDLYSSTGIIDNIINTDIIGLQDLGSASEPDEVAYMGTKTKVIKKILENRGDRQDILTLVTSNYPIYHNAVSEKYGDRIASRMKGMFNYFELRGKDRRG